MTSRTIDLSGRYTIHSVDAESIMLIDPVSVNPAWGYVDLDGAGTTGYDQSISLTLVKAPEVDLGGTYQVGSVSASEISLVDAEGVNADWGSLSLFPGASTRPLSAFVSKNSGNWIGPFIVAGVETSLLVANFVAQSGLYKDSGKKQTAFPITVEIEATPVDAADSPIGPPQTFSTTVPGNDSGRELRAITLVCELDMPGRQSVRARRVTDADYHFQGQVVDEVKWKDLYGAAQVDLAHFGDVTTIHTRTYATEGALAVRERQLNLLATRMIELGLSGGLAATTNAADIFRAICQDPFIGARRAEELDLDSIYEAVQDAIEYFGSAEAGSFSHTFDDDKVSFEESAGMVAQAVFCTAYRQGSTIRLAFERATDDSVLIFNHRNKMPASETRTVRFGLLDDQDGIELEYRDPADDAAVTIYIPPDRSAINPRKITMPGVRSDLQAYWQAWRAWGKIRFQNTATEFRALQEAAVVTRNERVLVADNTRPDTMDGEVIEQDGLELLLSQPAPLDPALDYMIFLQLPDGSVEALAIAAGSDDHRIILSQAPRLALALDPELYARTTYEIVAAMPARESAFLISEKQPEDNFTYTIRAINYSPMYYANDQLTLWLNFERGYLDQGPHRLDGAAVGASAVINDPIRGPVHHGAAAGDRLNLPAMLAPESYTKAFWVKRASGAAGSVLSSTAALERVFFAGDLVTAGHGGELASASVRADGEWAHIAITYDGAEGELLIYVDGLLAQSATIAQRALGALHAVGFNGGDGLVGSLSDLRLLHRALSSAEVRALYRATRL